jgi:hypothetical protein
MATYSYLAPTWITSKTIFPFFAIFSSSVVCPSYEKDLTSLPVASRNGRYYALVSAA